MGAMYPRPADEHLQILEMENQLLSDENGYLTTALDAASQGRGAEALARAVEGLKLAHASKAHLKAVIAELQLTFKQMAQTPDIH